MIEFTPGGYDKNVEQIRKEARAALLSEVLAVVDEADRFYKDSPDEVVGFYEMLRQKGWDQATDHIRSRLAALSPTPTRSVYEAMYCLIESAEGMSIQAELEHSFDLLRRALSEPNAEPGDDRPIYPPIRRPGITQNYFVGVFKNTVQCQACGQPARLFRDADGSHVYVHWLGKRGHPERDRVCAISPTQDAEPGERCPDCGTPAGFGHRAGCGRNLLSDTHDTSI